MSKHNHPPKNVHTNRYESEAQASRQRSNDSDRGSERIQYAALEAEARKLLRYGATEEDVRRKVADLRLQKTLDEIRNVKPHRRGRR